MTQVQTMTNQQINRKIAELLGRNNASWTSDRDYCTDPAASLEVQAKAIEVNASGYVHALEESIQDLPRGWTASVYVISQLLTASPRERAEAAYITLQGAQNERNNR